jgi:hypothetical protein
MKALIFGAALLAGCATASPTYGPDGRAAYAVTCGGNALSWASCQKKAGDICGAKGYDVFSATGDAGFFAPGSGPNIVAGSAQSRSMLVACKP